MYLFCIQKVSIRGKSRDIFKRMNNCFESLFFRQLFQEAYSLGKSCFIVIHISGSFDKLKQSYKRSYLQNKQGGFFNCATRTDRIRLRKGEKHFNLCGHNLFRYLNSRLLRRGNLKTNVSLWKRIKCFLSTLRRRNLKKQQSPVNFDFCLRKT